MSSSRTPAELLPCPPVVRRAHKSVIVGLAIFFAVIIALGEPFRGYQAEVRVSGPAGDSIDRTQVVNWIQQADPQAAVAVATQTSGASRVEFRIGRVATRLTSGTQALDDLARRLLVEELPAQHAAYRQRTLAGLQDDLQLAREEENALRSRAADLREKQLAQQVQSPGRPTAAESPRNIVQYAPPANAASEPDMAEAPREQQLETLRLELARLLANFTDEHPQVLAIRRQIESLEHSQAATEARETLPGDSFEITPTRPAVYQDLRASQFVSISPAESAAPANDLAKIAAELTSVQAKLSLAGRNRELKERKLQTALAVLAVHSPTAAWNAEPARIVARLGGTPRMLPVMLAILGASIAGVLMFRATRVLIQPRLLQTASDLAAALPIPLVGRNPIGGPVGSSAARMIVTPARVRWVTKFAECVLLTILAVCVGAIFLDPTLALQFTDDPLGVVSEIFGRVMGR